MFAISLATSFAEYLGLDSDLYELSCSSSIIINPKLLHGANIADLAPITLLASSFFILSHSSCLSPIDSLLCNTAILSFPNLPINLSNICGVSDISGTKQIDDLFSFKAFSINCKYTSVFPEPVIPYSKNSSNLFSSIACDTFKYACFCSSVNSNFLLSFTFLFTSGFLSIFLFTIFRISFFTKELTVLLEISAKFSISGIVNPSLFFINSTNFFCFSPFNSLMLISSYGIFKYTKFTFLSCTLSSLFLALVPGVSINLIHSDTLQKYLLAIHLAKFIFSGGKFSSSPAIGFTLYSVFSFIFII